MSEKQNASILDLALRTLTKKKSESQEPAGEVENSSDEQIQTALEEFKNAGNPADAAKAFKAAIELIKNSD